jgi:hypothetical protein
LTRIETLGLEVANLPADETWVGLFLPPRVARYLGFMAKVIEKRPDVAIVVEVPVADASGLDDDRPAKADLGHGERRVQCPNVNFSTS